MFGTLTEFEEITCTVWTTIAPDQSCPFEKDITIKSLQYSVSLLDLIVPDISASFCESRFNVIFQELHGLKYTKQCTMNVSPDKLEEIL